jgi:hypothetical protein
MAALAEREVKREMLSEAGGAIAIPDVQRFDSNIITPVSAHREAVSAIAQLPQTIAKSTTVQRYGPGSYVAQSIPVSVLWQLLHVQLHSLPLHAVSSQMVQRFNPYIITPVSAHSNHELVVISCVHSCRDCTVCVFGCNRMCSSVVLVTLCARLQCTAVAITRECTLA